MSDPDLTNAYALRGADETQDLYARWAKTYDAGFAQDMDYQLHLHVADRFAALPGSGPVIDLGAGTGLLGEALSAHGIGPLEATDLSPDMLAMAQNKGVYDQLFPGDLLGTLPCETGQYAGAVSAGTFTHGHVGPEALAEVIRIVRPRGWVVLSINAAHYDQLGFGNALHTLSDRITDLSNPEVPIYGPKATGPHARDTAYLTSFRVRDA